MFKVGCPLLGMDVDGVLLLLLQVYLVHTRPVVPVPAAETPTSSPTRRDARPTRPPSLTSSGPPSQSRLGRQLFPTSPLPPVGPVDTSTPGLSTPHGFRSDSIPTPIPAIPLWVPARPPPPPAPDPSSPSCPPRTRRYRHSTRPGLTNAHLTHPGPDDPRPGSTNLIFPSRTRRHPRSTHVGPTQTPSHPFRSRRHQPPSPRPGLTKAHLTHPGRRDVAICGGATDGGLTA